MEVTAKVRYEDGRYVCISGDGVFVGTDCPEETYLLWLRRFDYVGPALPQRENKKEGIKQ